MQVPISLVGSYAFHFFGLHRLQNFNDRWAFRLLFSCTNQHMIFSLLRPHVRMPQNGRNLSTHTWTENKVHIIACGRKSTSRLDVLCTTEGYHASFGRQKRTGGVLERDSRTTVAADECRSRRSEGILTNTSWALAHLETKTRRRGSSVLDCTNSQLYPQPFLIGTPNRAPMFMADCTAAGLFPHCTLSLALSGTEGKQPLFLLRTTGDKDYAMPTRKGGLVFLAVFFSRASSPCSGSIKEGEVSRQLLARINLRVTHRGDARHGRGWGRQEASPSARHTTTSTPTPAVPTPTPTTPTPTASTTPTTLTTATAVTPTSIVPPITPSTRTTTTNTPPTGSPRWNIKPCAASSAVGLSSHDPQTKKNELLHEGRIQAKTHQVQASRV